MLSRLPNDLYILPCRIIQQLVNGIIAPTAMTNIGVGPWYVRTTKLSTMYVMSLLIPKTVWRAASVTTLWMLTKLTSWVVVSPDVPHFCWPLGFSSIRRGMLHSNPMDYAWGANGLDSIITQVRRGKEKVSFTPQWRTAQWCFSPSVHIATEKVYPAHSGTLIFFFTSQPNGRSRHWWLLVWPFCVLVVIEPVWKHWSTSRWPREDQGSAHRQGHGGACGWVLLVRTHTTPQLF